ncbi:probable disease resistance RPP8-like protein 2 isoform X2 [Humulus lupulus]|uniref:probable disease resistance RPP8-like protein 2 isoform X2 n=1 Tax=Humulus lupulus TaxID=3486 RepID=UPI002B40142B|nr:probable disease resistance RPP8-like protein 2 isoform X2 [Humulus lupulus]
MPTLEKLSRLRVLSICNNSFKGNEMVCSTGGFPQLESLKIESLEDLEEWKVEEGALSSLRHLQNSYCWKLRSVPDGLRCITTLKKKMIRRMSRNFLKRLEEGGEDFYKVEHVPSFEFLNCYMKYFSGETKELIMGQA